MALPTTTYTNNASNLQEKSDYGLKISKAGFDVNTAQDNDLLFNSSWPSMQIVMVREVTAGSSFAHGLPYPPFSIIIPNDPPPSDSGNVNLMRNATVDSTNVYAPTFSFSNGGKIIVYAVDITVDVEYPYTAKPRNSTQYDPDYGIKIVKEDEDIDSSDLRDYILHSKCGSPMVLAVKTASTVSPNNLGLITPGQSAIQYTNQIDYPTFIFGYVKRIDGKYEVAPLSGQAYPSTFTNGTTSYIILLQGNGTYDYEASLVVLRTPMFASKEVSITV